ncbi:MAG: hypothetical protein KJ050_16355 [Candidatus Omnitrophica bacterium]|nr:hypothetical protein [Candidatus Omnitrophota bacterium]
MKAKSDAAELYIAYHTKTEEVMAEIENGLVKIKMGVEDKAFDEFYKAMKGTIEAPLSSVAYKKSAEMLKDQARQQAKTFATNLTDAQLNTMAQTVADGLKEGLGTHQVARRLTMVNGLDINRARTLQKYVDDLKSSGVTGKKLERMTEKRFNQLLTDRRETIAQTEARFATSHARQTEAVETGAKFKIWMTVGDDRVSQQCRANQSAGPIPVKEHFPSGQTKPPAHPNCRCTLAYSMSKKQADLIHKEIEGQPFESPVPKPPKPKTIKIKPEKIDDAVNQLDSAIPDIPDIKLDLDILDPSAPQPDWGAIDKAWEARRPNLETELTFVRDAKDMGGMHSKSIYQDAQGNSWLFKPQAETFRTHGEEAAYKIGRWIDPEAVEVRSCTLNGKTGSIQRIVPSRDLTGDMSEIAGQFLDQVQREHVIDWLVSNHDGHPGQWIIGTDGHLYGIDKGQGWRFFGTDVLNINYHPNRTYGAPEPLYNTLFREAKTGKWKFTSDKAQQALEYIKRAEAIPESVMREALKEYAAGRPGNANNFVNAVLSRQEALRRDFEQYYSAILGKPFSFADDVAAVAQTAEAEYMAALERHASEVRKLGAQGKTLKIDREDIEDQNIMVFTEKTSDGATRTVLSGKLRPEAESRFISDFDERAGVRSSTIASNPYHETVLKAVKTVQTHWGDKQFNVTTLNNLWGLQLELEAIAGDVGHIKQGMAQYYLEWLHKIEEAVEHEAPLTGTLKEFKIPSAATWPATVHGSGYTLTHGPVTATKRELKEGITWTRADDVSENDLFARRSMMEGSQYNLTFPDGTKAIYRPFGANNAYARAGQFEITVTGEAGKESIRRALDALKEFGVDTGLASALDEELMYLQKHIYLRSLDNKQGYKKLAEEWADKGTPIEARVEDLKKYLQKNGVTLDPSSYDPAGVYELGFLDKSARAGHRVQYRADLPKNEFEREMGDYVLQHSVTGGNTLESALEAILQNSGDMVSTIEKLRVGIKPGGMSPEEDMNTGGASYFFTRIRKRNQTAGKGLFFKPDLLKRLDAISYDSDKYGRTTGNTPRERAWNYQGWKAIAQARRSDETIFKYAVNLLEGIDHIKTGSAAERKKIIAIFHKRGIFKLPDGRKVEEIVR